METISFSTRKSRKEHKCDYCESKIEKGEKYNRAFLKADFVYVWKSHLNCQAIASELNMFDDYSEGVGHYEFLEFLNNAYYEICNHFDKSEDEDTKVTTFLERLEVVCQHHLNDLKQ